VPALQAPPESPQTRPKRCSDPSLCADCGMQPRRLALNDAKPSVANKSETVRQSEVYTRGAGERSDGNAPNVCPRPLLPRAMRVLL